jgi:hypothetical protein
MVTAMLKREKHGDSGVSVGGPTEAAETSLMGCGHKDFDIVLRSNDVLTAV